jgi:hypothetical protein
VLRPSSGTWKTYRGWKSPKPVPGSGACSQPSVRSCSPRAMAPGSLASAAMSLSRLGLPAAIAALMVSDCQRRVTTCGPILTVKTPRAFRCASSGAVMSAAS